MPPPDGLSTLDVQIMRRQTLPDPKPERDAIWTQVTVRLKLEPSVEQMSAIAAGSAAQRPTSGRGTPKKR